ncbi:MAG: hypothetical protein U1E78_10410 [Gammaproteobacteria bacterium]
MKSSRDTLNIIKQQDGILDSAYQQLLMITKKSDSIAELMNQVQAYLRENPAHQKLLESPSKTRNFIIKLLNEDVLHKECDSEEALEGYRLYLGCLAIHIIKNADPSFDEEEIIYDCINTVIKNIYLKILQDAREPLRKYSFYGNIRTILLNELEQYIDLYILDYSFRDLILKLFREEREFRNSINCNFTPSSESIIYYFHHYVLFLNELNQTPDCDAIVEIENMSLMLNLKNSSTSIYSKCESFYQNLTQEIQDVLDTKVDLIENKEVRTLIEDFKALNTTLKLLSSIDCLDKKMKNGLKKFENKMFPKLFSNFKRDSSPLFQEAEAARVEFTANQILERYKKYEKLVQQGAAVKLNDELCEFIVHFYNHGSNIYQRELIKSLFNSIIIPKTKIKILDPIEKEIDSFLSLHKIMHFILKYQQITANELIAFQEQDIENYLISTNTDKKESAKKKASKTNLKSSVKNRTKDNRKKQIKAINSTKHSTNPTPPAAIVVSTENRKIECNQTKKTNTTKTQNKNKKNRTKKKVNTQSATTLSKQDELLVVYPQQMIFRVGAEPLSNRSVHKVHEDCEMGDGNNPENSAVKGINSDLVASVGYADSAPQPSVEAKVEHFLSFVPLAALNHMNRISQSGYQVLMFGGAVRDILWKDLGRNNDLKYNDIDLITDIPDNMLIELFPFAEKSKFISDLWHVRHAGDNDGLTTVDIKLVSELNLENLFQESYLAVDSLACDLTGKIYDPLNVLDKFLMPELQLVSNEKLHFKNNPERILKTIKTASHLPANLSEPLIERIIEHKHELSNLDLSHMLSLLTRICLKQQGDIGFKTLVQLELIDSLFPVLGEKIQSCSLKNSIIHSFIHEKFKSFNDSELPCSKYSLLAVFLIPYFEKMMTLDKKYYSEEEIKSKLDIFFTKANIKPTDKTLWAKRTLGSFMRYWKEFEAFEFGKQYSSYTPSLDQFLSHKAVSTTESLTEVSGYKMFP